LVGTDIDARVNQSIYVDEPAGIDARRTASRVGNPRPRHERVRPKWPKLCDGRCAPA
jgi:hypothetical protein